MGIYLLMEMLGLEHEHAPDWDAAGAAIENLPFSTLWHSDELFPWEGWLLDGAEEYPYPPAPLGVYVALRCAHHDLEDAVKQLRTALDSVESTSLVTVALSEHTVVLAGGIEGGSPNGLYEPLEILVDCGIAQAAGFTVSTSDVGRPISDGNLGFKAPETRGVYATRAFVICERHARRLLREPSPIDPWSTWVLEPLSAAASGRAGAGQELIRALGGTYALALGLSATRPSNTPDPDALARRVLGLVAEGKAPKQRSLRAAVHALEPVAESLRARARRATKTTKTTSPGKRLAADLLTGVLLPGLLTAADVLQDTALTSMPAAGDARSKSSRSSPPRGDSVEAMTWLAYRKLRWSAIRSSDGPAARRDVDILQEAINDSALTASGTFGPDTLTVLSDSNVEAAVCNLAGTTLLERLGVHSWGTHRPPSRPRTRTARRMG